MGDANQGVTSHTGPSIALVVAVAVDLRLEELARAPPAGRQPRLPPLHFLSTSTSGKSLASSSLNPEQTRYAMPRDSRHAAGGSTKKLIGLGRLRWYCTPCSKQCRDENAFKQHTLSESHVRNIDAIGSNLGPAVEQFSQQFKSDFLNLLRLNHREKSIQVNRFYQTYIADRNHIHLNATRWHTLSDFAKWLGREGLCRVEEKDDGIYIAWIDTSPDALQRATLLDKKIREEAAGRLQEERQLEEQVKRAQAQAEARAQAKPTTSPLPTQPTSLTPTQNSDTNITIRVGHKATNTPASPAIQPKKKSQNIFKMAGRKRERPAEGAESAERPKVKRRAITAQQHT